ncbi:MAG: SAM-dependent methyltransferase [Salibaculum sp.]|jgi:SAM-dependent MidA family methyltransferase|uniref:class I SAM-dependent methyltransferase n=1 Tax=Salibaculum sp. TaxID=2855480 RepID=UPI00286FC77D|nr:SAM-dependent methyltransferase [Salibaculum sp.]MDR9427294.1 SAM-dependent methyltransferase [Salibaculum sp.]MDR9481740.1 SAM-dependent methyltransferase [Salibaculum sp.]
MTPLGNLLARRIAATGPMPLSDYMAECLLHPKHGYYSTRDPLGQAGDFITAPEVSQMFGEVIGLALAQAWMDQGAPAAFVLAELGPGRGTLMADALRATAGVPGFHAAAQVILIEASAPLRAQQAERLPQARHIDGLDALPAAPLFLVANEFFDALPIRQFQRDPGGWREVMVGLEGEALRPGLSDPAPLAALDHRLEDTAPGDIVETCPALPGIVAQIGTRLARHGGAALILDYGDWRALGDTFQALEEHAQADPFAAPGRADLTAHVDFEALALAAAPACHTRLTAQGVFLERLGITDRARALARGLHGAALDSHVAAHRRLTHPDEMGHLFKVMGLFPEGHPAPPGLET